MGSSRRQNQIQNLALNGAGESGHVVPDIPSAHALACNCMCVCWSCGLRGMICPLPLLEIWPWTLQSPSPAGCAQAAQAEVTLHANQPRLPCFLCRAFVRSNVVGKCRASVAGSCAPTSKQEPCQLSHCLQCRACVSVGFSMPKLLGDDLQ